MFVHNSRPLIINSFNEYQTSLLKFCETTVNISSKTIYTTVLHIQRIVWFFWSAELWVDPHKIIDKKGHMRSSFAVNLYKCTCIVLTDYGMHGYLWQESYFLNLIYERFSYFSDLNRNLKTHLSKMSVYVFFLHLKLYNLKFKFKSNESIQSWFALVDHSYEIK